MSPRQRDLAYFARVASRLSAVVLFLTGAEEAAHVGVCIGNCSHPLAKRAPALFASIPTIGACLSKQRDLFGEARRSSGDNLILWNIRIGYRITLKQINEMQVRCGGINHTYAL